MLRLRKGQMHLFSLLPVLFLSPLAVLRFQFVKHTTCAAASLWFSQLMADLMIISSASSPIVKKIIFNLVCKLYLCFSCYQGIMVSFIFSIWSLLDSKSTTQLLSTTPQTLWCLFALISFFIPALIIIALFRFFLAVSHANAFSFIAAQSPGHWDSCANLIHKNLFYESCISVSLCLSKLWQAVNDIVFV